MAAVASDDVPLSAPEALTERHIIDGFDSGVPVLDDWLSRRALPNQVSGASRTFVTCRDNRVVAYYALAAGGIASSEAPGRLKRNMPSPIPVFVLGRLAVDRTEQGKKLGALMLRDAATQTYMASRHGGIAGLLVHAISENAKRFYLRWGFVESPSDPSMLVATMKDLSALIER